MVDDVTVSVGFDTTNYDAGMRDMGLTAVQIAKAVQSYDRQLKSLQASQKKGTISSKQLSAATEELQADFIQLSSASTKAAKSVIDFGNKANTSGKQMKRFGAVGMQQVGYQVQDFAVQVQGGQNALVALGQQGSQLLGIFGPAGAVAGAILAIGTGVVNAVLATQDAEKAIDKMGKNFETSLSGVSDAFDGATSSASQFGNTINQINMENIALAFDAAGEDAAGAFEAGFFHKSGRFLLANTITGFAKWSEIEARLAGEAFVKAFGEGSGVTVGLFDTLKESISELDLGTLDTVIQGLEASFDNMTPTAKEYFRNLVLIRDKVEETKWAMDLVGESNIAAQVAALELTDEYERTTVEALALGGVDLTSNISSGTIAAGQLAAQLGVALGVAQDIQLAQLSLSNQNEVYSGRGSYGMPGETDTSGEFNPSRETVSQADILLGLKDAPRTRSGGGSKTDPTIAMADSFGKLMDRLNQVDPLITAYNDTIKDLDKWQAAGAITTAQYSDAVAKLGEELKAAQDPLAAFKASLEDALDGDKNYAKGLEALQSSLADFLFDPFESGIKGMVLGFSNALRKMAAEALAAQIMKSAMGMFGGNAGNIASAIFSANGNVFSGGSVQAFADGGVVSGPTVFPISGNKTGVMGEAGPEAIMPLTRKNGKLGVESSGGQAPVENNIKVINIDDRASIGQYLSSSSGEKVVMNVLRRNGVV
jgi:hypothetical protein